MTSIIWQTIPILYIATKIVELFYIVYSALEYLARTSARIVVDVATELSPINYVLDFAVVI